MYLHLEFIPLMLTFIGLAPHPNRSPKPPTSRTRLMVSATTLHFSEPQVPIQMLPRTCGTKYQRISQNLLTCLLPSFHGSRPPTDPSRRVSLPKTGRQNPLLLSSYRRIPFRLPTSKAMTRRHLRVPRRNLHLKGPRASSGSLPPAMHGITCQVSTTMCAPYPTSMGSVVRMRLSRRRRVQTTSARPQLSEVVARASSSPTSLLLSSDRAFL